MGDQRPFWKNDTTGEVVSVKPEPRNAEFKRCMKAHGFLALRTGDRVQHVTTKATYRVEIPCRTSEGTLKTWALCKSTAPPYGFINLTYGKANAEDLQNRKFDNVMDAANFMKVPARRRLRYVSSQERIIRFARTLD